MAKSKAPKLHATRNDLGANVREASVGVLNATLADTIDLTNGVRMAHWTVRGPHFAALHALFETFYDQLGAVTDDIAERVVQLGGTPDGTTQMIGEKSRLEPYPADLRDGIDACEGADQAVRRARQDRSRWRSTRRTRPAMPTPPTC